MTTVMQVSDVLGCRTVARGLHARRNYVDENGKFLPTKPARTPPGLPIPGSTRIPGLPKIMRRLLRRALPPPAQLLLEALDLLVPPGEPEPDTIPLPAGWVEGCVNNAPSGSGSISNYITSNGRISTPAPGCIPVCLNNQALGATNVWTGSVTTSMCKVHYLAPGSIPGRWDIMRVVGRPGNNSTGPPFCFTACPSDTITEVPGTQRAPYRLPGPNVRTAPPEWIWPDLIPEIVPPTAPRLDPPGRLRPTPTYAPEVDHPWLNPDFGTTRGPAPSARPMPFNPNPDFDVSPTPGVVTTPGPSTTPTPAVPGLAPIPTIPRTDWPPISRVPIVERAPGVELRIDPPGYTRQRLRPPGRKTKERKFIVAVAKSAASRIVGGITEGMDMVECLHASLPKKLQAQRKWYRDDDNEWRRSKKPSLKRQAAALYKHMDDPLVTGMTIFNALTECGYEQAKDRFYAALGRAGGKAGRRLNLSSGFGLGGATRSAVTGGTTPTAR